MTGLLQSPATGLLRYWNTYKNIAIRRKIMLELYGIII